MSESVAGTEKPKAGLFDIRIIIASLIGVYGVILVITGLLSGEAQAEKAAGLNINVLAGVVMLVFAASFVTWARLRPIVVAPDPKEADEDEVDRPVH